MIEFKKHRGRHKFGKIPHENDPLSDGGYEGCIKCGKPKPPSDPTVPPKVIEV